MLDSGTMILLITLFASAICMLSIYSVYGNVIRHETTLHELRNRVEHLQNQQALKIAQLKGEISPMDVEIIEESETIPESGAGPTQFTSENSADQSEVIAESSSIKAA
ncbi:MAG: hypothetical protein ACSHX5_01280 [Phycisphaerales bacterium]